MRGIIQTPVTSRHLGIRGLCFVGARAGAGRDLPPEVFEPIRGQLGVAYRVLDVLVPEVGLQSARIVPGIGQRIAAAMAQHVRMDRKWHLRPGPDPAEQRMKRLRRHRPLALGHEDVRGRPLLAQ